MASVVFSETIPKPTDRMDSEGSPPLRPVSRRASKTEASGASVAAFAVGFVSAAVVVPAVSRRSALRVRTRTRGVPLLKKLICLVVLPGPPDQFSNNHPIVLSGELLL